MALRDLDLPRKLTYEDYVLIPEDGQRHEILDGEHYVTAAPFIRHQLISSNLHSLLGPFIRERRLGTLLAAPTDVLLSPHDIAQPDLLFISNERAGILKEENVQGAPDLVIEILSKDSRRRDEGLKLERYGRCGVLEYWIVDPKRKGIKVYRREGSSLVEGVPGTQAQKTSTRAAWPGAREIRLSRVRSVASRTSAKATYAAS